MALRCSGAPGPAPLGATRRPILTSASPSVPLLDSAAGKYQEIEGPAIAGGILVKYGMSSEKVEHVCRIIASHHSAKDIDTLEFRIIWDSDWLVNIPDECGKMSKDKLKGFIKKIFRTKKGREIAKEVYL